MQRRTLLATLPLALAGCATSTGQDDGDDADTAGDGAVEVAADDDADPGRFEPARIEAAFLERFNDMRADRGLAQVHRDEILHEMGQAHATNMAEHDYVGHVQPDTGRTIEDRFRSRGLLPECELAIPGSNEYYPGAENAAGAAVGRVTHPGTDETFTIVNDDDVAAFLMDSWLTSQAHREVMVLPTVEQIGLGVAVRDDGEIFAALQFC